MLGLMHPALAVLDVTDPVASRASALNSGGQSFGPGPGPSASAGRDETPVTRGRDAAPPPPQVIDVMGMHTVIQSPPAPPAPSAPINPPIFEPAARPVITGPAPRPVVVAPPPVPRAPVVPVRVLPGGRTQPTSAHASQARQHAANATRDDAAPLNADRLPQPTAPTVTTAGMVVRAPEAESAAQAIPAAQAGAAINWKAIATALGAVAALLVILAATKRGQGR